jgi:hypothetical protein
MIKNTLYTLLILCQPFFSWAQMSDIETKAFIDSEDSLLKILPRVCFSKKESNRFEANKTLLSYWNSILQNEKSIQYAFDSLKSKKYVSIINAPDNKFRLITWNLFKDDGTFAYFGFLQVNTSKTIKKNLFKKETLMSYELYSLIDKSGSIKNPESYIGEPSKWFGMLYVDVIKTNDDDYTLIGWDGNDKLTQRKFIDVLYFKSNGIPTFGKDLFKVPGKFVKRMMFEYATEVAMSLKYTEERKQIIYSHLAPNSIDPTLEGQFQYYGPDGSFDALTLKKGKWYQETDIDVRKLKDKNDNAKRPNVNKQTPIYKP